MLTSNKLECPVYCTMQNMWCHGQAASLEAVAGRTPAGDDPLPKQTLAMCTVLLPSNGSGLSMGDTPRAYEEGIGQTVCFVNMLFLSSMTVLG